MVSASLVSVSERGCLTDRGALSAGGSIHLTSALGTSVIPTRPWSAMCTGVACVVVPYPSLLLSGAVTVVSRSGEWPGRLDATGLTTAVTGTSTA